MENMERNVPTRAALMALEKVFTAEIDGRLPFQSKAKIFRRLCDEGLLAPMERKFGGRVPVTVTGYQLTDAGRIVYCSSCETNMKQDDDRTDESPPATSA